MRYLFLAAILLSTQATLSAQPVTMPATIPSDPPLWVSLRQYVYQEAEVEAAEKVVMSFEPVWCWFLSYPHKTTQQEFEQHLASLRKTEKFDVQRSDGYWLPTRLPYPATLNDVPTEDRGVRLSLQISPGSDP